MHIEMNNQRRLNLLCHVVFAITGLALALLARADNSSPDPTGSTDPCTNATWQRDAADDISDPAGKENPSDQSLSAWHWINQSHNNPGIHVYQVWMHRLTSRTSSSCHAEMSEKWLPSGQSAGAMTAEGHKTIFMKWSCDGSTPVSKTLEWSATLAQQGHSGGDASYPAWLPGSIGPAEADADSQVQFETSPAGGTLGPFTGGIHVTDSSGDAGLTWAIGFPKSIGIGGTLTSSAGVWDKTATPLGGGLTKQNTFESGIGTTAWAKCTFSVQASIPQINGASGMVADADAGVNSFSIDLAAP